MSKPAKQAKTATVKLTRPCQVGGKERKAGDTVQVLAHTAAWLVKIGAATEIKNPA